MILDRRIPLSISREIEGGKSKFYDFHDLFYNFMPRENFTLFLVKLKQNLRFDEKLQFSKVDVFLVKIRRLYSEIKINNVI